MRGGRTYGRSSRIAARLLAAVALFAPLPAGAWGFKAHRLVNRLALETLPADAATFFSPHKRSLMRKAVEPDSLLRERNGEAERVRHFIDLDAYLPPPFLSFPRDFEDAVARFGRETIERNGILPWALARATEELRDAIRAGDVAVAVQTAAYVGHYAADAYQPLHLTVNYDGQNSRAAGLHRRFEKQLVEVRLRRYAGEAETLLVPARVLPRPLDAIFDALGRSYAGVGRIVEADAAASRAGDPESRRYRTAMGKRLDALVARQLADAATMTGCLWLTAWREAGLARKTPAALDAADLDH